MCGRCARGAPCREALGLKSLLAREVRRAGDRWIADSSVISLERLLNAHYSSWNARRTAA
jgi:hypothetical protein